MSSAEDFLKKNSVIVSVFHLGSRIVTQTVALEAIRLARKEEREKIDEQEAWNATKDIVQSSKKLMVDEIEARVRVQARDDAIKEMIAFVESEIGAYADAKSPSLDLMFLRSQFKRMLKVSEHPSDTSLGSKVGEKHG